MPQDNQTLIANLQQKIDSARTEANAWKGKNTEHYRMGCILVDSLEKQLSDLIKNQAAQN